MDFERSTEIPNQEQPKYESGYSEEEQAKAVEGSVTDRKRVGIKVVKQNKKNIRRLGSLVQR